MLRSTGTPPDLWKYGISGDLPIVLVTIADAGEVGLAQDLVRAQEYLRARGFKFDLVVLNEIPTSYRQDVQDDLQRIAEAGPVSCVARSPRRPLPSPGGRDDRRRSRAAARGRARGVRRSSRRPRGAVASALLPPAIPARIKARPGVPKRSDAAPVPDQPLVFVNGFGGFTRDGREFHVSTRPPAPWSNVIANERFGFVATESSLGNTWSENSYQNRLTPWNNDPVVDPPGEVIYLRDEASGEFWTATASPAPGAVSHLARFGQGYVVYEHRHRGLHVELTAFVAATEPVKVMRLRMRNMTAVRPRVERLLLRGLVSRRQPYALGRPHRHVHRHGVWRAVRAQPLPRGIRLAHRLHRRHRSHAHVDRRSLELHRPERNTGRSTRDGIRRSCPVAWVPHSIRAVPFKRGSPLPLRATVEVTFLLGEGTDESAARALVERVSTAGCGGCGASQRHRRGGTIVLCVGRGGNTGHGARHADQPVAAVSDAQLPLPRAVGVLSVRRRVRVSRSAAGRAGAVCISIRHLRATPHSARGRTAVSRGGCSALVARAGRRRRPHAHPGRPAVARVRRARIRARDGRLGHLRRRRRRSSRSERRDRMSTACTRRPGACRSSYPSTTTARARSRGRWTRARTGCR